MVKIVFQTISLLLLPYATSAGAYDSVYNLFQWSDKDLGDAMTETKLDQKLSGGLAMMKDVRHQLETGLPNEDVRTNVALNLEGL
mmetsp:Transcript_20503/g.30822  ORF Transcript_20503/g.30822 Transcript_20503/m.30822 type:complete len:85 (-) Transcript_20503:174-428(-)|eukprot:CAMPEP_0178932384 /NCGR_PEP_ID=MMETSP0786-20121207/22560_1 /TAXON_ID=186022 /ORGANISM="Thalassionema frauenfeldii, Strain CCMP 1798" /LENGTH=84 /DNA_ID=CAMNT_0020609615 /DNA_START=262 /DNA_END=516 /DNA_ORIENTATION=-